MRALPTVLALMLGLPVVAAAQQGGAVVYGRVLGMGGDAIASAVVDVLGLEKPGAFADSLGRFRLEVPSGEWVLRAQIRGHDTDFQLVSMDRAASVDVVFRLGERPIPIDGTDRPLPERHLLDDADRVVMELLETNEVGEFVRDRLGAQLDTVTVFVPWSSGRDAVLSGGPSFRVRSDCEECSSWIGTSIHGVPQYAAAEPHLRIGVRSYRTGTPRLTFCLGVAFRGDVLSLNCVGPRRGMAVHYAKLGGRWRLVGST